MKSLCSDVAVLVNTCDKNHEALIPFFELIKRKWKEIKQYKIYINTETIGYSDESLDIHVIKSNTGLTWTERLRNCLFEIKEEYIIFFLEDHFLLEKTNNDKLIKMIETMHENKQIGWIYFPPIYEAGLYLTSNPVAEDLFETKKLWQFRINANIGLWRKRFLLYMLYDNCSPWEFEIFAGRMSIISKLKATLYWGGV